MRFYTLISPVPIHRSFKLNKSLSRIPFETPYPHKNYHILWIFFLCHASFKDSFHKKSTWSAYPTRYILNHGRSHPGLSTLIASGSQKCCSMATATTPQQSLDFQRMMICSAFYFLWSANSCCWSRGTVTLNARVCKQQVAQQDSLAVSLVQSALPISETLITGCPRVPLVPRENYHTCSCCTCSLHQCLAGSKSQVMNFCLIHTSSGLRNRPRDTCERQTWEGEG